MSVKDAFSEKLAAEPVSLAITPELKEKIINAFIALEELLSEAFPNSYVVGKVLMLLELAAYYVSRLLK